MCNSDSFVLPDVSEDDIAWASNLLGLKKDAFDDARKVVLFSKESIDVAACPGSGKTTLLVAKLAILARGWTDRRRGICVISHTNAAREVITERLGATAVGQSLLSYPHYIGTIHGFVDRFLGIPWIKACGFPVSIIDTELTLDHRWKLLHCNTRGALENKRNGPGTLKLVGTDFSLGSVGWGNGGKLGQQTESYKNMIKACRQAAEAGCFCYEDPFLWGKELAELDSGIVVSLRDRFPILFVDEAQDNSELQSSILHQVFANVDDESSVVCQRFGDANQAIYHSMNSKEAPKTWVFPVSSITHDIPDSYRFGATIAAFAQPLGVEQQALTGRGPDQRKVVADVDDQHTIFLFDDLASKHVLPAYARHLKSIFDQSALESGSFIAVGAKHKEPDDDKNKPNSVCDYWDQYAPKQAKIEPRPDRFIGFFQAGRSQYQKKTEGNLHCWVEQIAAGLLEAVRISKGKLAIRQRKNRYIKETLLDNPEELQNYTEFVRRFVVDQESLTKLLWDGEWKLKLSDVAVALWNGEGECQLSDVFFESPVNQGEGADRSKNATTYQAEDEMPRIRLGSIHSVKGETHTSVLVFETFNRSYNLKALNKWLLGKEGKEKQRQAISAKLKVHYVAMTRPTHLLCLALPSETFTVTEIKILKEGGWRIERITAKEEMCGEDLTDEIQ
jgi:DNA helicase-2/ATP-dependent DNA helicase PcrA